jgi:hypothetical protein
MSPVGGLNRVNFVGVAATHSSKSSTWKGVIRQALRDGCVKP